MKTHLTGALLALTLAATGFAWAQTAPSPLPTAAPGDTAAPVALDAAHEAAFKAADKMGTGYIEGTALEPFKPVMDKIDTDRDGKISRAEFAAAVKAGIIK